MRRSSCATFARTRGGGAARAPARCFWTLWSARVTSFARAGGLGTFSVGAGRPASARAARKVGKTSARVAPSARRRGRAYHDARRPKGSTTRSHASGGSRRAARTPAPVTTFLFCCYIIIPQKKKKKKKKQLHFFSYVLLRSQIHTHGVHPKTNKKRYFNAPRHLRPRRRVRRASRRKCGRKAARPAAERRRGADENRSAIGGGRWRRSAR